MSKMFHCLPSDILNIQDEYTAYCFNEACLNIIAHLQNKEKPHYKVREKEQEQKHYTSFEEFYKTIK